ncbi:heat-shock protein Hsp20 [Halorubrum sp. Ib24]|uniref:Hsp20/alpha crystallin family protein n=1 Tax=unclassified Halorubrum TaxID=2642239 RepID=UPI000B97DB10|nr:MULTISPECIES: Hsp20/alpha crystallin family protein [unclassified Halorubrum]OYR39305.1 heat-shock protein Hsp20 [Halorubrum sp. Eb13]OYR42797.1 heat-shock protein Hsp20 [Halorubrum sp. Ib24]OYR52500.1 heat-shock protein Hsp20 [Halorubrum sp. Ea1]
MTRRDPFGEIEELLERMGREFEELGGTLDSPGGPQLSGARDVAVDVIEDDESITVHADLPGFEDEDIEVELREDSLSIAATREEERDVEVGDPDDAADSDDSDVRYHRRERRSRSVSRRVPIAEPVERDGATASYDNGVLTVTLPKRSGTGGGHSIDVS